MHSLDTAVPSVHLQGINVTGDWTITTEQPK